MVKIECVILCRMHRHWKGGYSTEDFVAFKLGRPLMIYSSQRAVNGREVDQDLDHRLLDAEV